MIRLPFKIMPKYMVVNVWTGLNRGMKWIAGSGINGLWLGNYEFEKQEAIKNNIRPGMVVIDVGANAGFYTLAFSRLVGKAGQVWAFEPFAENARNILQHIGLNKLQNVTFVQAAVTDRNSMIGFKMANNNASGFVTDSSKDYMVPTVSLDELILNGVMPKPDLIKIDVEGAESLVLEGAKKLLSRNEVILFVALHGKEQKRLCQNILRLLGYEIFSIDETKVDQELLENDEIIAKKGKSII